jgi:YidC/Oxa1 family membrane protein insertase
MKVMNPNYEQYGLEALDVALREKVGVSVNVEDVEGLNDVVSRLLYAKDAYRDQIEQIVEQYIYHPGRSGEAGGRYIIERLESSAVSDAS